MISDRQSTKDDGKIWVSIDQVRHHATCITLPVIACFPQWPVDLLAAEEGPFIVSSSDLLNDWSQG